jgi:ATP-dependent helicase HrpA
MHDNAGPLRPEAFPRDEEAFEAMLAAGLQRLGRSIDEITEVVGAILNGIHAVQMQVGSSPPSAWMPVLVDIKEQLDHLVPTGFLSTTPFEWLRHFPRYLAAIQRRLTKLAGDGLHKDLRKVAELAPYWRSYVELANRSGEDRKYDPAVQQFRWMLEEYRVSLFAQELRTSMSVSTKKLEETMSSITQR